MTLGESIRTSRQKAFFTQQNFAKTLNVALSTVNRWEQNKAKPNMKAMKSIKTFCIDNDLDYTPIENAWLTIAQKNNE